MAAPRSEPHPFRLMDLPVELRLLVYETYLTSVPRLLRVGNQSMSHCAETTPCTHVRHRSTYLVSLNMGLLRFKSTYAIRTSKADAQIWPLLWANKQIREEATPLYFESICLEFKSMFAVQPFLQDLTPSQRISLRHISLHLEEVEAMQLKSSAQWARVFDYMAAHTRLSSLEMSVYWYGEGFLPRSVVQLTDNDFLTWMGPISKITGLEEFDFSIAATSFTDSPEEYSEDDFWDTSNSEDSDSRRNSVNFFGIFPDYAMKFVILCTLAKKMLTPKALKEMKETPVWNTYRLIMERSKERDRMLSMGYSLECSH